MDREIGSRRIAVQGSSGCEVEGEIIGRWTGEDGVVYLEVAMDTGSVLTVRERSAGIRGLTVERELGS